MKKGYVFAFVLGVSIFCLMGAFTRDWDESVPTDSTVANQIDEYNRYLRVDTSDRLENMFYGFIAGENTLSQHCQYLQFYEQASITQPSAGYGRLGCKAVSGKCELHWHDEDGDEIQLTSGGYWNGAVLLADSVDSAHYVAGSVDAEHLAADIIDETKIADDGIDSEHYNDGSVDPVHIHTDVRIKGWGNVASDGTLDDSYNVTSVSRTAAGKYTITWATDFANADYSLIATCIGPSGERNAVVNSQVAATADIWTYIGGSTVTDAAFNFMAIGDQ